MMNAAQIGPTVHVKGQISAQEDLSIAGRVEGTIDVAGHNVTIETSANVKANVTAEGIVVAGTTHGKLTAGRRIELTGNAVVKGDLAAPCVAVQDGALVCGKADVPGTRGDKVAQVS